MTPSLEGYTFTPLSQPFDNLTTNQTANFTGTPLDATYTRYFAEGAVGAFFDTTFTLFNPGDAPASAVLRFESETGEVVSHPVDVPASRQVTVDAETIVPTSWVGFSTAIEADQVLATSRTMTWGDGDYGSETGAGVAAPQSEWWITEGATGVYQLFYLLQNPGDEPAEIDITYLRPGGDQPTTRRYTVAAHTRRTFLVNSTDGVTPDTELGSTEVSAHIVSTNDVPIVAERAMYLTTNAAQPFTAGTLAAAVPASATRWTFAEGSTGFFNLFLLLANPSDKAVDATVRYLLPQGTPIEKTHTLAPASRQTVWVNAEDPLLEATPVAVEVVSTEPILAERAMWWGADGQWDAGHVSTGAAQPAVRWGLAGFALGGPAAEEAYVLVANPNAKAAEAQLTLTFEDDRAPLQTTIPIAGWNRATLRLADIFPEAVGARVGVTVESIGAAPVPLAVEGAAYASPDGAPLTTGRATPAVPLP